MGKPDTENPVTVTAGRATDHKARGSGWRSLWLQPLLLGLLIIVGLVGALLRDGWWDLLFSLLLTYPIFKICYHFYRQ